MIETSNPEIDVNELMKRVRNEAEKIRARENIGGRPGEATRRSLLPILSEIAGPPPLGLSRPLDSKLARVEVRLQKARDMIEVSRWIPRMFRRLFRRQGAFNRATLETMTELAKTNLELNKRVCELAIAAGQQNQWLHVLSGRRQMEAAWMRAAGAFLTDVPSIQEKISQLDQQLTALEVSTGITVAGLEEARVNLSQLREIMRSIQSAGEEAGAHLRNLQAQTKQQLERDEEHLRNLQTHSEREAELLRDARAQLDRHGEHLRNLQGASEMQIEHLSRVANFEASMARLEERHAIDSTYLKGELSRHNAILQQRRGDNAADVAGSIPKNPAAPERDSDRFDSFYLSFEDRFRGTRSEIKERARFYLPLVKEAKAGERDRPVLDLGCGRGEWLELLQENGLEAEGVDLSGAMVAQCEQRNLAVRHADAVEYLRSVPDNSYGAVSGFHIIEHLPFETLMDLLSETRRVLQPGGLAIFESPNCKNIVVGASNFYSDPTHRNPVFPDTAGFLLEINGFERVWLEYLSPVEQGTSSAPGSDRSDFQNWFYGPRDFAALGYKPASS